MILHFYDRETILAALTQPLNSELHTLLAARIAQLEGQGLLDMTEIVVVDASTTEAELINILSFSPLTDLDGTRFGEPDFVPMLDHVVRIPPHYHVAFKTVGNSGFAFELVVPDNADPELVALCKQMAVGTNS